jgi:hypothetical protein
MLVYCVMQNDDYFGKRVQPMKWASDGSPGRSERFLRAKPWVLANEQGAREAGERGIQANCLSPASRARSFPSPTQGSAKGAPPRATI